jgi:hypothetical protein
MEEEKGNKNALNNGQYIPPATPTGSARTFLGPIVEVAL